MMRSTLLVAALSAAAQAQQCTTQNGVAFVGLTDIAYALVGSAGACCSQCSATPLCAAYTFVPTQSTYDPNSMGRCYLKTSSGNTVALPGAVSGALTGAQPTACPIGLTPCAGSGACAMFASQCAAGCSKGQVVCPDGATCSSTGGWASCPNLPAYLNSSLPIAQRVASIVSQLSMAEAGDQMSNRGYGAAPLGPSGITRLSIPPYNWLNEGLHGDARSGVATSFPQISVVGNTFNRSCFSNMGKVLGVEARAKNAMYRRQNATGIYTGVTFYAPNINLARDARWGRIQEVPTEDPYLMGEYARAVVQAAQSPLQENSTTPAIAACCKHAVAYSVEGSGNGDRAHFNAIVSGSDLLGSYLPHFQTCFVQGGGRSSMCSYNAVNGVPTCLSNFLLNVTFRTRYGFDGWVMSDYGSIGDSYNAHHYCASQDQCTAQAIINGCDQDGGGVEYASAPNLISEGLLATAQVQTAVSRLFTERTRLGLLDLPEAQPFITDAAALDSDLHRQMSYEAAQQGMVLLSNPTNVLPLTLSAMGDIAVVGPNANNAEVLVGNYNGTLPFTVTVSQGVQRALGSGRTVLTAPGCDVPCASTAGFPAAIAAANTSSVTAVVAVIGLDTDTQEAEGHDRSDITLPGNQLALLQALQAVAKARGVPFIVACVNGGPIDVSWAVANADAIVLVGYASQSTGDAFADVLFGKYPVAGKLAVTWPRSIADLPPMPDMGMQPNATAGTPGRTYRFSTKTPLFPFGYGLTYTSFSYTGLTFNATSVAPCAGVGVSVTVTNTGKVDSSEVVQLYLQWASPLYPAPQVQLVDFDRVWVPRGSSVTVNLNAAPRGYAVVNASAAATFGQNFALNSDEEVAAAASGAAFGLDRDWSAEARQAGAVVGWDDMFVISPGQLSLWVGSGQPGTGAPGAAGTVTVVGSVTNLAQCTVAAALAGRQ